MNTDKLVLGILGGLAAGAVLGILFAPDKGSNTRKKITNKGSALADDIGSKYNELKSEVSKTVGRVREEYANLVQDGQSREDDLPNLKSHLGKVK